MTGADWFHMVHPSISVGEKRISGSYEVIKKQRGYMLYIFKNDGSRDGWLKLVSRARFSHTV